MVATNFKTIALRPLFKIDALRQLNSQSTFYPELTPNAEIVGMCPCAQLFESTESLPNSQNPQIAPASQGFETTRTTLTFC